MTNRVDPRGQPVQAAAAPPDFGSIVLALIVVIIGLQAVKHYAPRWSWYYVGAILLSGVIFQRDNFSEFWREFGALING